MASSSKGAMKLVWGRTMVTGSRRSLTTMTTPSASSFRFGGVLGSQSLSLSSTNGSSSSSLLNSSTLLFGHNQQSQQHQPRRMFGASADTMVDLLSREYDEEIENGNDVASEEIDASFKKLSTKSGWKIIDNGKEDCLTKLYKTLDNGAKVQLFFHCQDIVDSDSSFLQDEEVDEENEVDSSAIKFTVCVTKGGKTVIFTCLSDGGEGTQIQSVMVNKDEDVDAIVKQGGTVSIEHYQGPDFTSLAEDVQDAMYKYLEEDIGVTSDVTEFISLYSEYKETNQYINFLDQVRTVIQK